MFSQGEKEFLTAAEVCDNQTVEDMIKNMSEKVLQMAYSRTWNNVRITENEGYTSDYRSILEIIRDEMDVRGVSPPTSKNKKHRSK